MTQWLHNAAANMTTLQKRRAEAYMKEWRDYLAHVVGPEDLLPPNALIKQLPLSQRLHNCTVNVFGPNGTLKDMATYGWDGFMKLKNCSWVTTAEAAVHLERNGLKLRLKGIPFRTDTCPTCEGRGWVEPELPGVCDMCNTEPCECIQERPGEE